MEQIFKLTKYVDPMIDVAFKQLFGQEKNKHLTKGLLEQVFKVEIEELEFVNVEHPGATLEDRAAVFDIQCRSKERGEFIVEMQLREQRHFGKRALYYSTFPINAQAPKGEWNFDYRPVYFLGVLNFKLDEGSEGFIHRYSIREDSTGAQLTDALQFVFMEAGPFDKKWEECVTFEEKFLYYFKNLPTFAGGPDPQRDEYFAELLDAAEYSNMTKAEREAYNRRLKILRDNYAADEYTREKQEEKMEKFRQEMEKARAEALEKGHAEGRAEEKKDTAAKMLAAGLDIDLISSITGLQKEEILKLKL